MVGSVSSDSFNRVHRYRAASSGFPANKACLIQVGKTSIAAHFLSGAKQLLLSNNGPFHGPSTAAGRATLSRLNSRSLILCSAFCEGGALSLDSFCSVAGKTRACTD